jgi:hypothetical protein
MSNDKLNEAEINTWLYWMNQQDLALESDALMEKGQDIYDAVLELCQFRAYGERLQ